MDDTEDGEPLDAFLDAHETRPLPDGIDWDERCDQQIEARFARAEAPC